MTPEFDRSLPLVLDIEQGYVNHPADRGGPTNHGVTLATLDRWSRDHRDRPATVDDVRNLDKPTARRIYWDLYWCDPHVQCQALAEWWWPIAHEVFDSAVLHGPRQAALFLQRAINLVNRNEAAWEDIAEDGWAGPATRYALSQADAVAEGRRRVYMAANIEQAAFLRNLVREDPAQEAFYYGWLKRRVSMDPADLEG